MTNFLIFVVQLCITSGMSGDACLSRYDSCVEHVKPEAYSYITKQSFCSFELGEESRKRMMQNQCN